MSMNQSGTPVRPLPDTAYYQEEPVSTGEWMWTILLMGIPVVNLILMLVWAFGGGAKVSKRNYFRAALIWAAIGVGVSILASVLFGGILYSAFLSGVQNYR